LIIKRLSLFTYMKNKSINYSGIQILINVPDLNRHGGVSTLFRILKMEEKYANISLFTIYCKLPTLFRIPIKYIEFIYKLNKTDVVHINPSLTKKSFFRDALFAWLTRLFSKKLIVYWHGWEVAFESKIKKNRFLGVIAKQTFLKADASIVLGEFFQKRLEDLGCRNMVYIETNTADNKNIQAQNSRSIHSDQIINLLFLSRLEIEKGLYIAIETLNLLNKQSKRYKLLIAGSGSEEANVKQLSLINHNIEYKGYVADLDKHNLLESSNIIFLPSFSEGLPLSLLEGMIYGLPIISRPIGGIPDIIINGENGYLIESLLPGDYADKIEEIVNAPEIYKQISQNNITKSKLFSPDVVRERIYKIYESVYHGN
jgi:glycosyltransferase involved in cell wall biosynthesis